MLSLYLEKVMTSLKKSKVDLNKYAKAVAWSYQNDGRALDIQQNKLTQIIPFAPNQIQAYEGFINTLFNQKFVLVSPKQFNTVKDIRSYVASTNSLPPKTNNQKWLFWCKEDPYPNAAEMFDDMKKGILIIYSAQSQHTVFSKEMNWKNRAVHDAFGHFVSDKDPQKRTHFNLLHELKAADISIRKAPVDARPIFFTEVIGQASNFNYNAKVFGTQKSLILQGFDYNQIGKMQPGYRIEPQWPFRVLKSAPKQEPAPDQQEQQPQQNV